MTRRVTPTRLTTLIIIALAAGILAYAVVRAVYGSMPPLQWHMPVWVGVVAVAEGVFGWRLRRQIHRAPGTEPADPIVAARALALAKASAILGAAMTGMWAGGGAHLLSQVTSLAAARADLPVALAGVVLSLLLVGAGLFLEHACRAPDQPDDDPAPA